MFLRGLLLGGLVAVVGLWAPRRWVEDRYSDSIFPLEQAPPAPVAIVFGAGLRRDGRPTAVLADRVEAAARLYQAGIVDQILMSGTATAEGYDEPAAMADLARRLGVPDDAITTDGKGTRTLTTCDRAKRNFGIEHALLVSQSYHLPRALATCDGLDIVASGVAADLRDYNPRAWRFWRTREMPATLVALIETRLVRVLADLRS